MSRRWLLVMMFALAPRALAQPASDVVATIHPIYAAVPEVPNGAEAHAAFVKVAERYKLGPVEVIDVPGPPSPRAAELLKQGRAHVEAKRFAEGETALDAAVAEVNATGAAGLDTAALADLFLHQAMAAQRADWKDPPAPLTDITPAKAKEAYLRAAVLSPERSLLPRQFPPIVRDSWRLATAEVKARPRGALVVRAPSSALISIDGGPLRPGLVAVPDLLYGEHRVRVEDPGRKPWAAVVPVTQTSVEVDVPPQPALTLDDAAAVAQARRQGAAFALVAELPPGAALQLRLLDTKTGARRNATSVAFPIQTGALDAAVLRLEEEARRSRFADERGGAVDPTSLRDITVAPVAPGAPVAGPRIEEDPESWARARWPLLTAIGVAAATALVLGIAVAKD